MKKEAGQKYRLLEDYSMSAKKGDTLELVLVWQDKKSSYKLPGGGTLYFRDVDHLNPQVELIEETTLDTVNSPNHYIGINGLEVEQVLQEFIPRIEDSYVAHRIASAIEYILRSPLKNGEEDYRKAMKNLEQVLEYNKEKEGK